MGASSSVKTKTPMPASISATMGHGPWSLCQCLRCEMRPGLGLLLNGRSVCRTPRQRAPATAGTEPLSLAAIELLHSLGVDVQGDLFVGRRDQARRYGRFRVEKEAAPHRHAGDPVRHLVPLHALHLADALTYLIVDVCPGRDVWLRWLLSRVQVAHVAGLSLIHI